ncbi:MAG: cytidine deaminase [Parachlamydiaceae bacterium]
MSSISQEIKTSDYDFLMRDAITMMKRADCRFSDYRVGAALLTESGNIISGCNVETWPIGGGRCAERVADEKAVSKAYKRDYTAVAVASIDGMATPCGSCRQQLVQANRNMVVITVNQLGAKINEFVLRDLLPTLSELPNRFEQGLPMGIEGTILAACQARDSAYVPYSRASFGAAVLTESGAVYSGTTVDAANYSSSVNAVQAACAAALTANEKTFQAVVFTSNDGEIVPDGSSLQMINEFTPNVTVIMTDRQGVVTASVALSTLLPHAFGPKNLQ